MTKTQNGELKRGSNIRNKDERRGAEQDVSESVWDAKASSHNSNRRRRKGVKSVKRTGNKYGKRGTKTRKFYRKILKKNYPFGKYFNNHFWMRGHKHPFS